MEDILYTIEPTGSGDRATIIIALLATLAALGGMLALLRSPSSGEQRTRRMLAAMLLFFVVLIGASTAFFSWLSARKTGDILIYQDAIQTPYGKAKFADIKNAYIEVDKQPSLVNPSRAVRQARLLIIEENSGKAHVLSEKNYGLENILNKLKKAVEEWKLQKGKPDS